MACRRGSGDAVQQGGEPDPVDDRRHCKKNTYQFAWHFY